MIGSAARERARVDAERRLLAFLCLEPALASVQVNVEGCGALPISEAMDPSEFADPRFSAIFAVIREAAESARPLPFVALLSELADSSLKALASDLYNLGEDLLEAAQTQASVIGQRRTASEEVVVSWHDLENLERRARFRSAGERIDEGRSATPNPSQPRTLDTNDAVERLARARERGHDATAVSALFGRRPSTAPESGRSSNQ
jgi:hypothetical protein